MARPIMIQGTTSNAGKSLLCAALCRILHQDGLRVAPFKSQNMALNSYVTPDGLEMGRAQVLQAQAAGREADVRMNPILLKPTTDVGSQVIVNGVSRGNLSAKEYFRRKKELIPDILAAYVGLAAENDAIVIEGAGSPAEINLKENDIVNMGMAALVDAPVLLVGDIDPGGVFAQLYGTLALLPPEERAMVKGLVINKFRGDVSILTPGLRQLEALTHVPVLGVLPYLPIDLDDEDSLSARLTNRSAALVDIAVIRLPRLSNFTDFRTLERVDGVSVRYVTSPGQLGEPDLIILPGTKNTMADLLWLRRKGLEAGILRFAREGGTVLGICGGYQMLGRTLSDPESVEQGGKMAGLGLLDVDTVFTHEKTRTRVHGTFGGMEGLLAPLSKRTFEGYEIHMGRTQGDKGIALLEDTVSGGSRRDGAQRGNVYGTYVHGILDGPDVTETLVRTLAARKGIDPERLGSVAGADWQARQYDLLADAVRTHLDMEAVYRILEEGI